VPSPIRSDYTRGRIGRGRVSDRLLTEPMVWKRGLAVLGVALVVAGAMVAVDIAIADALAFSQQDGDSLLRGDVVRELMFLQQYGALSSVILVAIVVLLLDPAPLGRFVDAGLALATNATVVLLIKVLIGRPRPGLTDPAHITPPWETYGLIVDGQVVHKHAWEFWNHTSDLWSMPSSHSAAAMALSVVIAKFYPRLGVLLYPLALLVGGCRIVFGAHYPSDVIVGWAVGFVIAKAAIDGRWGHRLLARLSGKRLAGRSAEGL